MQSDLLDVVIGVVFVWFLLSVVLSGVLEGLGLVTHARSKHLWLGVGRLANPSSKLVPRGLLDIVWRLPFAGSLDLRPTTESPAPTDGAPAEGWVQRLVGWLAARWQGLARLRTWLTEPEQRSTSLVRGQQGSQDKNLRAEIRDANQALYRRLAPAIAEPAREGRLSKVTHLAAEAYAEAVADVARSVHAADLEAAATDLGWSDDRRQWLRDRLRSAQLDTASPLTAETVSELAARGPNSATASELRVLHHQAARQFTARDLIDHYKSNPGLQAALARVAEITDVDDRVAAARSTVETWFEREMDGLNRLYRRQTRKILLLLAVPLVIFAHANTITIFNDLRHDQTLRQATAIAATEDVARELDELCDQAAGRSTTTTTSSSSTTVDPIAAATERFECARDVIDRAEDFGVGLAWQDLIESHGETGENAELERADVIPYVRGALTDDWGLVGRTLTVVALLFGAQFWYDVLRRLVGLRQSVSGAPDRPDA